MGKTPEISLTLGDSVGVYFPGQSISGNVTVNLEEPKECLNVHVQFLGKGEVMWSESRGQSSVVYSENEEYMNSQIILKESDDGSDKLTLPAGNATYSFTFGLPSHLPASFNAGYGRITYTVVARIKRPWYKFDIKADRIISIIGILDLNLMSSASSPSMRTPGIPHSNHDRIFIEKSKNFCCLCCSSGQVQMQITLPKKSHVPGEQVKFSVEMSNLSSRRVSRTLATLIQTSTFIALAQKRSKMIEVNVLSIQGPQLTCGGMEMWTDTWTPLIIPPLPPTGLAGAQIIDVQYKLKFEIKFKGLALPLKVEVPIIIGTVPLRSTFQDFQSSQLSEEKKDSFNLLPKEQSYGILNNGDGLYSQDEESQGKSPFCGMYPDLPAFKLIKSVVNCDKAFDKEDPLITIAAKNESNEEEVGSVKPHNYHPFCIFFGNPNNS